MRMVMYEYAFTMRRLRTMEPMKLLRTDSSAYVSNRGADRNAPEEGHQGDEGEDDGGDDEAPLVFVYEIFERLLLVLVEVRLGPIEVVRIDDCEFVNFLLDSGFWCSDANLRYTMNQPRAADAPAPRKESREKKNTAKRTGMQQQKCLDIVMCALGFVYLLT